MLPSKCFQISSTFHCVFWFERWLCKFFCLFWNDFCRHEKESMFFKLEEAFSIIILISENIRKILVIGLRENLLSKNSKFRDKLPLGQCHRKVLEIICYLKTDFSLHHAGILSNFVKYSSCSIIFSNVTYELFQFF